MKSGVKSLIFPALFISNLSLAGWNTNVWPSATSYRASESVTNAYGQLIRVIITQASGTNAATIPQIFDSTDLIINDVFANERQDGGTNYFTNRLYGPVGAYKNAPEREYTNTYLSAIRIDADTNQVEALWTANDLGGGLDSVDYFVIVTNEYQVITNQYHYEYEGVQTDLTFKINRILAHDAYHAISERLRVTDGNTNVYNYRESIAGFKPQWGYNGESINDRDNLVAFKTWLSGNANQFVNNSLADTNGTFNGWFAEVSDWEWNSDLYFDSTLYDDTCSTGGAPSIIITTNESWTPVAGRSAFPMWSTDDLCDYLDLPHKNEVETNNYTATVPGWFAGDTNSEYVADYSFDYVSTNKANTWFDWTPYRDLNGWHGVLSNENAGAFYITPFNTATNVPWRSQIYDTCSNPYAELRTPQTNIAGTITQVVYHLERYYVTLTNAETITTGSVVVAHSTNSQSPSITITNIITTNAAVVYTNYLSNLEANTNDYPGGWSTNIVLSTNSIPTTGLITNLFTCMISNIAPGYTDADYGYSKLQDIVTNLIWTASAPSYSGDYTNYPNIGLYEGSTCTLTQADSAPFLHIETNGTGNPYGLKVAFSVTNQPSYSSDFTVDLCTNAADGCTGTVQYQVLKPGCYISHESKVIDRISDPGDPCGSGVDTGEDATVTELTVVIEGAYIVSYDVCCLVDNFPDPNQYQQTIYTISYTPIPCESAADCGLTNGYVYAYGRRSMRVTWTADDQQYGYAAAQYYKANNPVVTGADPDNESSFDGGLSKTFSEYAENNVTGSGSNTNFYLNTKPFQSDALTNQGWEITGELILYKWDATNGFKYK